MQRRPDRQEIARRNRAAVLSLIRRKGALSRTEIAQQLRLSPAAMTKISAELLERGILEQEPVLDLSPSQPRALLKLDRDWGHVLTVSITYNLAVAIVDLAGEVVHQRRLAGDNGSHGLYRDAFFDLLLPEVDGLVAEWRDRRLLGIGVLSYGIVDQDGVILHNAQISEKNIDLRESLGARTSLPVRVDEESRLLLMAQQWRREKPLTSAVAIACRLSGHGGNQALMTHGQIHYGVRGLAGEPAWALPTPHGPDAAREAMAKVREMGGRDAYFARLAAGAADAQSIYRAAVENFGYRVALAASLINPEAVFLITDYMAVGSTFLDDVRREAEKHAPLSNLEGMELSFGGERTDEERLMAAAIPILSRVYEGGVFDVPAASSAMTAAAP